jgi:hypothetical protein
MKNDGVLIIREDADLMGDYPLTGNNNLINTDITFNNKNGTPLTIKENGDFIVNGDKVENDIEVYHAMVKFLVEAGCLNREIEGCKNIE